VTPFLVFSSVNICIVNHRPTVGRLCLDSNEYRGTREQLANLDQMESDLENLTWFF